MNHNASGRSAKRANSNYRENCIKSAQNCSLLIVRRRRSHFYVVLRKLIPKLQAFSQSIQETPMVRFYSSVDSDDKMLIRQISGDGAFHAIPHQIAADALNEDRMLGNVPDASSLN